MPVTDLNALQDFIRTQMTALEMVPLDRALPKESETQISTLRRRGGGRIADPITSFSVVEDDGVVRFAPGAVLPYPSGRRGGQAVLSGKKLDDFKFENLEPNQVQKFLENTDELIRARNKDSLNAEQQFGLREWDLARAIHVPVDNAKRKARGRILLIVHGFISSTNQLIDEMRAIPEGQQFLKDLFKSGPNRYKQVLTFDHKTVSVSPVLNALDLHRELLQELGPTPGPIDVICHSRGGLVARWWLEGLGGGAVNPGGRPPRVIFLGSPLAGTSLASPANLRGVMDLLASIGSFFSQASEFGAGAAPFAAPFLIFAGALFKVFSYVTKAIAKTPIIDAGINMVAGISGMSRVGNNPELTRLRQYPRTLAPEYFAVKSHFQPPNEGWRFWRYFYNVGDRAKNLFMDQVFQEPNDLIVNTASMTQLGPKPGSEPAEEENIAVKRVLDYPTNGAVHHNNYFRQAKTIDFFRETLLT